MTVLFPFLILRSGSDLFLGSPGFRVVGAAIIVPGVLIYLWCACGFAFIGRGTPAPIDPPKELVAAGLYRYVRNPMYVGVLLVLLGETVYFGSATLFLYSALVFIMFNLFIVIYEEPTLRKKFGGSYERYCRTTPRWFPKFKK